MHNTLFRVTLQVMALLLVAGLLSCGPDEEAILLAELQEDLGQASAAIDSLNYQVDSVNLLLDDARAQADSLQHVGEDLLASVQSLSAQVRKFKGLYQQKVIENQKLAAEVEKLKLEKQVNQQAIAQLRSRSDSLNSALLDAHTSIRRQSDHIRQLEVDVAQAQDDVEQLRRAQIEVRLLAATEDFLKENGYLETSRPFGRAFLSKSYKLVRKLDPSDPRVRSVPIGELQALDGKLQALVDRYGKLSEGDDYEETKAEGVVSVRFTNEMLGGAGVLAVLK